MRLFPSWKIGVVLLGLLVTGGCTTTSDTRPTTESDPKPASPLSQVVEDTAIHNPKAQNKPKEPKDRTSKDTTPATNPPEPPQAKGAVSPPETTVPETSKEERSSPKNGVDPRSFGVTVSTPEAGSLLALGGPDIGGPGLVGVGSVGTGRGGGSPSKKMGKVRMGKPLVKGKGGLSLGLIHRIVRRHKSQVQYCYEQQLTKDPALQGKMVMSFTIDQQGKVHTAKVKSSTLQSKEVGQCVRKSIHLWSFPKPTGGGVVLVEYPFFFARQ